MKRIIAATLCVAMVFVLAGCGAFGPNSGIELEPDVTPEQIYRQIRDLIDSEKLVAFNPKVNNNLQDGKIILSADLKSKEPEKITNICVAFTAWDIDGNPVMIKTENNPSEPTYIAEVSFGDLAIDANGIWKAYKEGIVKGLIVDNSHTDIAYVSAIAIYFEREDGSVWENPHYITWNESYRNIKLEDYMNLKSVYDNLDSNEDK